jgi:hypothetical protein
MLSTFLYIATGLLLRIKSYSRGAAGALIVLATIVLTVTALFLKR